MSTQKQQPFATPYQIIEPERDDPQAIFLASGCDVVAKLELHDGVHAEDPAKGINPVIRATAEFMARACNRLVDGEPFDPHLQDGIETLEALIARARALLEGRSL